MFAGFPTGEFYITFGPVLEQLRQLSSVDLPFVDELVRVQPPPFAVSLHSSAAASAASYLGPSAVSTQSFASPPVFLRSLDPSVVESAINDCARNNNFDPAQQGALETAFLHRLALVQGSVLFVVDSSLFSV